MTGTKYRPRDWALTERRRKYSRGRTNEQNRSEGRSCVSRRRPWRRPIRRLEFGSESSPRRHSMGCQGTRNPACLAGDTAVMKRLPENQRKIGVRIIDRPGARVPDIPARHGLDSKAESLASVMRLIAKLKHLQGKHQRQGQGRNQLLHNAGFILAFYGRAPQFLLVW